MYIDNNILIDMKIQDKMFAENFTRLPSFSKRYFLVLGDNGIESNYGGFRAKIASGLLALTPVHSPIRPRDAC